MTVVAAATVTRCASADIFADPVSEALFREYALECANALLGPTTPQAALYAALEDAGAVQCFAAHVQGLLSGFAFVILGPAPHYGLRRFATVESLFVARVVRHTGLGVLLMREVEESVRTAGCEAIFYTAPVGSRLARLLFLSSDYRNTNHVFTKRLG